MIGLHTGADSLGRKQVAGTGGAADIGEQRVVPDFTEKGSVLRPPFRMGSAERRVKRMH